MAKRVQHPRGTTAQENNIIGRDGQLRVDSSRGELRLHNGQTPGGKRIPNIDTVKQLIASGAEGAAGVLRLFNTTNELQALNPNANTVAFVKEDGQEELYFWKAGAGDDGTIPSAIDGHWHRADSLIGTIVRLWRAGLVTVQLDGLEPTANMDSTMWLTDGELRIYDGADYVTATPALFARYLAATGGYFTGAFGVPDRIRDVLVEETDLNTITDSGWYKTSADAVNSPIAGVHSVETRIMSGTRGFQVLWVTNGKGSYYTRLKDGPAWDTTWDLTTPFVLPARLAGEQAPADDANLMVESGFYGVDDSTANRPFDHGSITVVQFEEDRITQQGIDSTGRILMTRSSLDGGDTWSDWAGAGGSPGEVTWHAASTVPFGKLKANGALVSRVTYAALFAVIGTTFGAGDGATTFRLPDLRGEFVRGWDDGRGIDIGRTFGSWQDSENKSHTHVANADSGGAHTHSGTTDSNTHNHAIETMLYTNGGAYSGPIVLRRQSASVNYEVQYIGNSTHSHTVTIPASGAHTHTVTVNSSGGVESRPRNVALLACIKY